VDRVTDAEFAEAKYRWNHDLALTERQVAIINDRDCWQWWHRLPRFRAKREGES
jgi:hypothetical protein